MSHIYVFLKKIILSFKISKELKTVDAMFGFLKALKFLLQKCLVSYKRTKPIHVFGINI